MTWSRLLLIMQIVLAGFGLYDEFAPSRWPLHVLPPGHGLSVAIIALTMTATLATVEHQRQERATERRVWDQIASRLSMCVPVHERDFYSLWVSQLVSARDRVDVTHLGPNPPKSRWGEAEASYFKSLRRLCSESQAQFRRVERLTPAKREWIRKLVQDFKGVQNFSLRVYRDPSLAEMPVALSVCRIDDRFAWVVAVAEQETTTSFRDLLLTGSDTVDLVRQYFQHRLWEQSERLIDHGVVSDDWEKVIGA